MVNTFDHIVTFPNIKKEIFEKEVTSLFINENTRVMHLYIKNRYNNRLNTIPGAKYSFSELEFFSSNTNISDNVIIGLPEIFKSIKRLELVIEMKNNSYEFVKLIDNIDKLYHIRLYSKHYAEYDNDSFRKALENSLIKHANTIQYFKTTRPPVTNILSSFVNLKILKVKGFSNDLSWDCLETLSLSFLQVLKTDCIPIEKVSALIENTGGKLIEVSINGGYHDENNNKRLIQSIYNKYGLNINVYNDETIFDWNYFFKVLYESSPTNLFKFKFSFVNTFELESLRLFLNNWNGRHPLLFQTIQYSSWGINNVLKRSYFDVINLYITQGIVSLYTHAPVEKYDFKDFDWIKADKKALKSWEYNF
ncbi:3043_t:CDS:2 [Rhizophagus irregularis]|nr:3043_t:CDS:2 [Rhizophagus irregularis]